MNKWNKLIVGVLVFVVFLSFSVTSVVFAIKAFGENISSPDAISYQISLLAIIVTVITLGGGIVGFFGWKENTEKQVQIFIDEAKEKIIQEAEKRIIQKTKDEMLSKPVTNNLEGQIERVDK